MGTSPQAWGTLLDIWEWWKVCLWSKTLLNLYLCSRHRTRKCTLSVGLIHVIREEWTTYNGHVKSSLPARHRSSHSATTSAIFETRSKIIARFNADWSVASFSGFPPSWKSSNLSLGYNLMKVLVILSVRSPCKIDSKLTRLLMYACMYVLVLTYSYSLFMLVKVCKSINLLRLC